MAIENEILQPLGQFGTKQATITLTVNTATQGSARWTGVYYCDNGTSCYKVTVSASTVEAILATIADKLTNKS